MVSVVRFREDKEKFKKPALFRATKCIKEYKRIRILFENIGNPWNILYNMTTLLTNFLP